MRQGSSTRACVFHGVAPPHLEGPDAASPRPRPGIDSDARRRLPPRRRCSASSQVPPLRPPSKRRRSASPSKRLLSHACPSASPSRHCHGPRKSRLISTSGLRLCRHLVLLLGIYLGSFKVVGSKIDPLFITSSLC